MYILMVEFSENLNIANSARDRFCVANSESDSLLRNTAKALWNIMHLYNEQFNRIRKADSVSAEPLPEIFKSRERLRTKYHDLISDVLVITKEFEPNTIEADKLICNLLDISELLTTSSMSEFGWEDVFKIYKTVV